VTKLLLTVDKTFDVTNIGIHLKAKEFNELLEDPNTIVVIECATTSEIGHFTNAIKPDVDTFESYPLLKNNSSAQGVKTLDVLHWWYSL
jgi:UPF0176 protein